MLALLITIPIALLAALVFGARDRCFHLANCVVFFYLHELSSGANWALKAHLLALKECLPACIQAVFWAVCEVWPQAASWRSCVA